MADGNPSITFRAPHDIANDLRGLAEREGGFALLLQALLEADNATAQHRPNRKTLRDWLREQAAVYPADGAKHVEAARLAEIQRARAEGFAEGQQSAAAERDKRLDAQWANLERQQDQHRKQVQTDHRTIAEGTEMLELQRSDLARQFRAFEREAEEAAATWAAEIQRRRDARAEAEEDLRDEGRSDLAGVLREMDRTGKQSRAVLALVRDAAGEIIDEQLDGQTATPGISLDIAARLIEKSADALEDPPLVGLTLPTDEGPKGFSVVLEHSSGKHPLRVTASLADLGIVLSRIAAAQPLALDDLPAPDAATLPEEEPPAPPMLALEPPATVEVIGADEEQPRQRARVAMAPLTPAQATKQERLLAALGALEDANLEDVVARAVQPLRKRAGIDRDLQ